MNLTKRDRLAFCENSEEEENAENCVESTDDGQGVDIELFNI